MTIVDTTGPSLTAPADVTKEQTSRDGTAVALGSPTVSDICDASPLVTNNAPAVFPLGVTTVTWTARDASGNVATATQKVTIVDTTAPSLTAPADVTKEQTSRDGTAVTLGSPTVSDICDANPLVTNNAPAVFPLGTTTVTGTATDVAGNSSSTTVGGISIDKTKPVITIATPLDYAVLPIGTALDFSATDPLSGVATISARLVKGTEIVSVATGFTPTVGVYTLTVDVVDLAGNTSTESRYFVIYDPDGGFVTGGGWFNSQAGAYRPDPTASGKANFGFVSKYQKGATVPTGNTEFQFKAGNLNFHSNSYEWLVVAGARAQFKGVGTINGAGSFGFMLTAIDGQVSGGGGVDKFRIKIWDKATDAVVYDNTRAFALRRSGARRGTAPCHYDPRPRRVGNVTLPS